MIEHLKGTRTRSMRNLTVEPAPHAVQGSAPAAPGAPATQPNALQPVAVDSARPALSLQIQFDFNSTTIRSESRKTLLTLANALNSTELRASIFSIEGHTDGKGSDDYNLRLSEQRALAVKSFLSQQGVDAGRLTTSGKGATQLLNTSHPFAAENRRVRIVNLD
jgi:outer membrane protein OmpA-like peptidoglycan-associated protein